MEATAPLPPGHTGRVALPFFPRNGKKVGGAGCSALYPLPATARGAAATVLRPARAACPGPRLPACDSGWVSRGPSVPISLGSVGQGALRADLRLGGSPTVPSASPLERGRFGERALFLLCRSLPHCFAFDSFFSPFLLPDFGRLCLSKRAVFCRSSAGGLIGRVGPSMNPRPEGLNLVPCAARYDLGVESARRGLTRISRILENCYHPESYMDVQDLVDGRTDGRRIEWRPRPIPWTPWPRRIVMGLERTLPTRVSGWTFSVRGRTDFKRREDSQKSTILSRTAAVFELPIRSGRNTPHPHLKPPLPPPQPPAPPSSPTLGAVVGHGGMLAGWWLVGGGVVEETRKQTTVARG
ncbi:uncharacterized protein LOC116661759 isoform X5 [Camelus ferus]|uniref:Uncharacterized protein LOC116661759 isoform X5 n=1 Tax=Camelus ferus TaxID=419612 RepID=A0A8B8SLA9_CAMFR|nr:uncharacterized protein LOC116661759 isoform X5 [Camelus ferus]